MGKLVGSRNISGTVNIWKIGLKEFIGFDGAHRGESYPQVLQPEPFRVRPSSHSHKDFIELDPNLFTIEIAQQFFFITAQGYFLSRVPGEDPDPFIFEFLIGTSLTWNFCNDNTRSGRQGSQSSTRSWRMEVNGTGAGAMKPMGHWLLIKPVAFAGAHADFRSDDSVWEVNTV